MGQILCNFLAMSFAWLVLFGSKRVPRKAQLSRMKCRSGSLFSSALCCVAAGFCLHTAKHCTLSEDALLERWVVLKTAAASGSLLFPDQ